MGDGPEFNHDDWLNEKFQLGATWSPSKSAIVARLLHSNGTDFEVNGPLYAANLTGTFRPFEDFLGDNPWMAGKVITWADFLVWEVLDQHLLFKPSCLDELPKLSSYHHRFKEQPTIKAFVGSPKCFEGPVMGKLATWGGTYPVHPAF